MNKNILDLTNFILLCTVYKNTSNLNNQYSVYEPPQNGSDTKKIIEINKNILMNNDCKRKSFTNNSTLKNIKAKIK